VNEQKPAEAAAENAPQQPTADDKPDTAKVETSPPESVFKNLKPSEHRYTLNRDRDEL